MGINRLIKTKGIVISEASFSESHKMLTILTPDLGKISCVAKGARKIQSQLLAASQIFAFSELVLYRGKGENYYINSAELIESFYAVRNDYDRLECAMNCSKFIRKYVQENQTSINMLKLLLNTIYILSVGEKNSELIKCIFELRAVCLLGYKPNIRFCGKCGAREIVGFSMKRDVVVCKNCGMLDKSMISLSSGAVAAVKYIVESDLKKIFSCEASEDVLNEIRLFNKVYMQEKLE